MSIKKAIGIGVAALNSRERWPPPLLPCWPVSGLSSWLSSRFSSGLLSLRLWLGRRLARNRRDRNWCTRLSLRDGSDASV
jgi:hypothetical protein